MRKFILALNQFKIASQTSAEMVSPAPVLNRERRFLYFDMISWQDSKFYLEPVEEVIQGISCKKLA